MFRPSFTLALAAALAWTASPVSAQGPATPAAARPASPADAERFMQEAERELADLSVILNQAGWVAATYITDDTEALSAEAQKNYGVAVQRYAIAAKRFDGVQLPPPLRRKFTLLKLALAAPPPGNPDEAAELTRLTVGMEADYGKGTYCRPATAADRKSDSAVGDTLCRQIGELSRCT